jgi:leader peptidase (prepilin peptidase) / N-methyltransferase
VVTALAPTGPFLATLGLLGLVIGSFLNVVIHRVPVGLSLVAPGSACPHCDHPVRPYDNVPVLSWLALRARCRDCSAPISARYPLVELATGALFVAAGWKFGGTPYTVAALALMAAGVALFMIDLDHRRLPFAITGVLGVVVVVGLAIDVAVDGGGPVPTALMSTGVWIAVYGGIWLATAGRGMGLGDVALAPVLGLALGWLGWGATLTGLMGGFVVGALVGIVLLASNRAGAKSRIPHGPFMLSGAALGLFVGEPLWQGYLGLVGLG